MRNLPASSSNPWDGLKPFVVYASHDMRTKCFFVVGTVLSSTDPEAAAEAAKRWNYPLFLIQPWDCANPEDRLAALNADRQIGKIPCFLDLGELLAAAR
jgi:hypothetical protein